MKTTTPSSSTTTEDDALPRILTYADVPMLAQDLDASDTLELYLLTRPAVLHGLANNTVTVTKRAIGLRYLPQTRSSSGGAISSLSAPLELTLEYGPARMGVALQHEALPRLVVAANAGDTDDATDDEAFISWDNDAKIYFTNDIAHETYTTANYVASLTGAVLQDLLYACCDYYAGVRGRRRYQPFTVMVPPSSVDDGGTSNSNPQLLLKSSSDLDFVTFVWQHLADVGVDLAPLLPPLQHRLVLHSTSMERVRVGTTVSQQQVARFYRHLYACWEALATANVSTTMTPPLPPLPVVVAGATPSAAPSTTIVQRRRIQDDGANNNDADPTASPTSSSSAVVSSSSAAPSVAASAHIGSVELPSTAPTTISATTTATPLAPTTSRPSAWPVSHSDQAAQAAQQAQQAAQDAANAGDNPAAAAQAAQQAAQAAQQAADTTVRQKAAQVREQMLHGDGSTMVNAMVTCFANPTYRLATIDGGDSNNNTMVTAYLYWDGVTYYRANLTPPYASIVTLDYHMPPPLQTRNHARIGGNGNNDGGGGGDLVDWTVFFLIAAFFLVGTLMLAQQVLGRNFRVIPPLYRLQRYFFDPLSYNYAELDDESERDKKSRGLGQEYAFAQDVIPLSMGGRRADHVPAEFASNGWQGDGSGGNDGLMMRRRPPSPAMVRTPQTPRGSPTSSSSARSAPPVLHHWGPASDHGDVELMPVPSSSSLSRPSSRPHDMLRSPYASDNDDDEVEFFENGPGNGILEDSSRLFRDPDLVDLPNLTSRSKVAVPVSMTLSSSQHHRRPSEASSTNSSQHHTTSMMGFDEL